MQRIQQQCIDQVVSLSYFPAKYIEDNYKIMLRSIFDEQLKDQIRHILVSRSTFAERLKEMLK